MTDIPQWARDAVNQAIDRQRGDETSFDAMARALMEERERAVKACLSARDKFAPTDDAYKACIYYVEAIRKGGE